MLRAFFEGGYWFLYSTNHDFILTLFSDCRNCILEVIRTKENKISDIKAKSKYKKLSEISTQFIFCFFSCEATKLKLGGIPTLRRDSCLDEKHCV